MMMLEGKKAVCRAFRAVLAAISEGVCLWISTSENSKTPLREQLIIVGSNQKAFLLLSFVLF